MGSSILFGITCVLAFLTAHMQNNNDLNENDALFNKPHA